MGYFPFSMGGKVRRPIVCDVEVTGPYDIGAGRQAYLATSPSGKTFVAESETGAIVGPNLEQVRQDVAEAVVGVMERQMEQARETLKEAETLDAERFWPLLERGFG